MVALGGLALNTHVAHDIIYSQKNLKLKNDDF